VQARLTLWRPFISGRRYSPRYLPADFGSRRNRQSAQLGLATLWGWRPIVQHYRFYKLYPDKSIYGRDEGYHLSDWHALLYARRINDGYAVDVWQGSRRIATVPSEPNDVEQTTDTRAPHHGVPQ